MAKSVTNTCYPAINITNNSTEDIILLKRIKPQDQSTADPEAFIADFELLNVTCKSKASIVYVPTEKREDILIALASNQMPLEVMAALTGNQAQLTPYIITSSLFSTDITVTDDNITASNTAFNYYKNYKGNPYSPVTIALNNIVLQQPANQIESLTTQYFQSANVGFDFNTWLMIVNWAETCPLPYAGTYYAYLTNPPQSSSALILPTQLYATLVIDTDGSISWIEANSGTKTDLNFLQNIQLTSNGASASSGITLQGVFQNMQMHDGSNNIDLFFVGQDNGQNLMVQPYQTPKLNWYIGAYDFTYELFQAVNLYMNLNSIIDLISLLPKAWSALQSNLTNFRKAYAKSADKISSQLNNDFLTAEKSVGEPVNVDVNIDTSTDVDTDVDTDIDTDVDVDIDIDVDIDVDFFACVDVDIDIDIDIDTDSVVDNVVDNVTDINTEIDTDIEINSNIFTSFIKNLGVGLFNGGVEVIKTILSPGNLAVMGGMYVAQKVITDWGNKAGAEYANLSPTVATPLTLWLDFLANPNIGYSFKWNTFATYVQTGGSAASSSDQEMILTAFMMVNNPSMDNALSSWQWSQSDFNNVVSNMLQYKDPANQYKAYQYLANYTYNSIQLPMKVATSVAISFTQQC